MSQMNYPDSRASGAHTENDFRFYCRREGFMEFKRPAALKEQLYEHWDDLWLYKGKFVKNETKGMKSLVRGAPPQDELTLLEIHGVDFQQNWGWIFGAKSDIISFEIIKCFRSFWRRDIISFILDRYGVSTPDEIYTKRIFRTENPEPDVVYHRLNNSKKDNYDAFVWVPSKDLIGLRHMIVNKGTVLISPIHPTPN